MTTDITLSVVILAIDVSIGSSQLTSLAGPVGTKCQGSVARSIQMRHAGPGHPLASKLATVSLTEQRF